MSELPKGWAEAKIGEICKLYNGRAFKSDEWSTNGLPIIRIQNLNNCDAKFNYFDGKVDSRHLVEIGALLFAWSGTPGTSFGAHVWPGPLAVLNQHIFKISFNVMIIDCDYFKYAINSKLQELIGRAHGGAGLAHVTKGKFEDTSVPLPPLSEQRRIVAKIERLMARSRAAREELEYLQIFIDRYNKSLYSMVFHGNMIGEQNGEGKIDQEMDDSLDSWSIPRRWGWTTVGELGDITGGITKNGNRKNFPIQVPYLRVANVYQDRLDLAEVSSIGVAPGEMDRVRLKPNDILIVEGNGSLDQIGRAALWTGEIDPCVHQNHIIKIRFPSNWQSELVLLWLNSGPGRALIQRAASSSSGLHTLSISKIARLPVPLIGEAEAKVLIQKIRRALANIEPLMSQVSSTIKNIEILDRSILSKAFRGALVPQDPAEEPAAALLARIRSAPDSIAPVSGRRGRPPAKSKQERQSLVGPSFVAQ